MQTKFFLASKSIWSVAVIAAGVVVENAGAVRELLGPDNAELAGRLIIAAGLLLSVAGRLAARTRLTVTPARRPDGSRHTRTPRSE